MITRALDSTGDWTYGKGIQDYLTGNAAISQNINTRLSSFLGNCFFAVNDGIDWMNLLTKNNQTSINLAVSACILNTTGVTGIRQLAISVSSNREIQVTYQVQTVYSVQGATGTFQYDLGEPG